MEIGFLKKIVVCFLISYIALGCQSNDELNWNQEQGYRWAEVTPGFWDETGFKKISASKTGIIFVNHLSEEQIAGNRNLLNGSGVAAGDVDGDGLVDLYFAQLEGPNSLYKNMGGFKFKDITESAGVAHEDFYSTGVVFADVDGDEDLDLLVTSLGQQNLLYINDGQGHFHKKTDSGLGGSRGSTTMALADIDSDGDLDLYICNYKRKSVRDIYSAEKLTDNNTLQRKGDSLVVVPPYDKYYGIIKGENGTMRNEYGERDELYINNGNGKFTIADLKKHFLDRNGIPNGLYRDWGLTAQFQDVNADGLPDLYVANDFWTPDRLWINQGKGIFRLTNENVLSSMSLASMGVDFSDINRDGAIDFFVTEMLSANHQRRLRQISEQVDLINEVPQFNRNSLYLNRGDNTFAEISYYANLEATEWSWAANFLDINFDGYEDLIITTGHPYDYQDIDAQLELLKKGGSIMEGGKQLLQFPKLELSNKIFRNNGDLTFSDMSTNWGFTEKDISQGMAYADLDNDADPDLVMNRLNQRAAVFENTTNNPRIAVKLEGNNKNTEGIGAKVELIGANVKQKKEMVKGGSYISSSQPMIFFAADEKSKNHQIRVNWPDGSLSEVDSVHANLMYVIEQGNALTEIDQQQNSEKNADSMFVDVSDRINHSHDEDHFSDTKIQPLLPVKISVKGPGVSWIDIDRDSDIDLMISAGKGNPPGVFENNGDGQFTEMSINGIKKPALSDQTTILGWEEENHTIVTIGSANLERGAPKVPSGSIYFLNEDSSEHIQELPGTLSTTGPLAAADYDSDGDVDLFVGGSFKPANYPRDASSRLFKNESGTFQLDLANSKKLTNLGLVSGVVFSDYDQDGDPDLLISRQWDSLVLLQNNEGSFRDVSSSAGLKEFKGWWNGVATGDFNNDGQPDIIAGNIGKNSVYQLNSGKPLKLFYSDWNMDGRVDIIDSYYNSKLAAYVPRRRLYAFNSLPSIRRAYKSHNQFARSTIEDIFKQGYRNIPSKEINMLEHVLFINTGSGFEPHSLPSYAQFSAVFHVGVADFNNDGNEDLILSQNLFELAHGIPRIDAGRGLVLMGNGTGSFTAVKGHQSGIKIYGEQRGAAVADFNKDGKSDLAITQNKGATKLYKNISSRSGIRINLVGEESNLDAVGSAIRLIYKDGSKGPLREIQSGSGYWSQQSKTQVLGIFPGMTPALLEIHWYNGTLKRVPIGKGTKEISINID